tara:strand:- start:385 stop:585 length:201 start_codon:yes stop_codon:yes gene_type:complete
MFTENVMWLFGAYLAGSVATYYLIVDQSVRSAAEQMVDNLIDNGFLRHKKSADGEIEILKWNAKDE